MTTRASVAVRTAAIVFALAIFLFLNLCLMVLLQGWGEALTSAPIVVAVEIGDLPKSDQPQISFFDRKGVPFKGVPVHGLWTPPAAFVSGLRLSLTPAAEQSLQGVRTFFGVNEVFYSREQFFKQWRKLEESGGISSYGSPAELTMPKSSLSFLRNVINWPGDKTVIVRIVAPSLLGTAVATLLVILALPFFPMVGSTVAGKNGSEEGRSGLVPLFSFLFALAFGFLFFSTDNFNDTMNPRGDAWEYQSIAVNLATGHGFHRSGSIEPYSMYKFETDAHDSLDYQALMAAFGGTFRAYRSPGYPAFLGGIYAVSGVSPLRAKQVQLLLLVLSSAFLPFVGYKYWRSPGLYGGIVAGALFLQRWHQLADRLYTECLITATVMVFLGVLMFYMHRPRVWTAALLGFVGGLAMLVKGDLILLAPLVLAYLLFQAYKKRTAFSHALVLFLASALTVLPWSIYATQKGGQFTLLSTMANDILLDGNNEKQWENGQWHPEFREVPLPDAFYNRPDIVGLPTPAKVAKFYLAYPGKIPRVLYNKLNAGFSAFIYLRLGLVLVLLNMISLLWPTASGKRGAAIARIAGGALIVVAALNFVALFVLFVTFLFVLLLRHQLPNLSFPLPIAVVCGNFVLICMLVFGDTRFNSVSDPLFTLTGIAMLFYAISRMRMFSLATGSTSPQQ